MTAPTPHTIDDEFEQILAGYPDAIADITTALEFGAAVRAWSGRNGVPIEEAEKRLSDVIDAHRAKAAMTPEQRVRAQADALGIRDNARARFLASRTTPTEGDTP